ncbi:zinc metalloproteinase-disintegrin-like VLAIP-B [Discoglossus pictus]
MAIPGSVLVIVVLLSCLVGLHVSQKTVGSQVVQPKRLFAQHKRDTQSNYPDVVHYGFNLNGNPLVLDLQKTEGLISDDYTETNYLPDGTPVTTRPDIKDHCNYQGNVKNDSDSLVVLSVCRGLSGLIQTQGQRYIIEPLNKTENEDHIVYEEKETPRTCGVTNTTWMEGNITKTSRASSNAVKQEFLKSQKYIQLYVVADNSMFKKYNRSKEIIRLRVIEILNFVNMVYKEINTFVALTGFEVWDKENQFIVDEAAGTDLDRFSEWRKKVLLARKNHDNAQFLTNTDFTGATVGLAYVGTLCSESHSTGVIQDHSKSAIAVGATVAHEMGHNLGMNHDSSACSCSADTCIMSPTLSYNTPRTFSSCSHQNFQEFILDRMPICMKDKPVQKEILTPPLCGNKFTEAGEECDCGSVEECTNPCCDAATCKMKPKAKCVEGECCENCQIKKGGVVCRPFKDECDLSDVCDGRSAVCPPDRFRVNGFPCKNGQGICYNGNCPIRQNQCAAMWGASSVVAEDSCFSVNRRGVEYGNCGRSDGKFIACAPKDVKCGMLYCFGGSNNPAVYGNVAMFSRCKTVIHTSGMVENGTMCGNGMVCQNSVCQSIESAYRASTCQCSEHAVCDHELKCQCEEGWEPPHCDTVSSSNVTIIVVVVILVVIAVIAIALLVKFRKGKQRRTPPAISGSTNPAFGVQDQRKQTNVPVSTPEMSSRNLLYPPVAPPQTQKPQISFAPTDRNRVGYQGPQYSVTTSSVEQKVKEFQRPSTAPPPCARKQTSAPHCSTKGNEAPLEKINWNSQGGDKDNPCALGHYYCI